MKVAMTRPEFVDYMKNIRGTRPVGLSTITEKKDINGVPVTQFSEFGGLVGFNYENSVKKHDDPTFVAQPLKWGKHAGGAVIEHTPKGSTVKKYYIQTKVQSTRKPVYFMRGRVARPTFKARSKPKTSIVVRTYNVDSIVRARIDGKVINLVD
jgi:hypothetical protein